MSGINLDFDKILKESDEIYIEPDKNESGVAYGKATKGSLRSGELGKCFCIAAYDPEDEVGYMAHIDPDKDEAEFLHYIREFMSLIEESKEGYSLEDISFLLGGSCYENPFKDNKKPKVSKNDVSEIGGQREIAEKKVKSRSEDVEVNWGGEDGYYYEVVLDTESEDVFSYNRKEERLNSDK